ncbi:unnamed protein product [Caenorhabditis auriculariae]|uniref:CHK kinase-like domain-containing protein n=1 Tax=Caenorhabditis auriculariae TaxID=2777116 RepID=A0A8S1HVD6_9PELO|nr:unnamed protein product [Caenorhabditis auriculariae]
MAGPTDKVSVEFERIENAKSFWSEIYRAKLKWKNEPEHPTQLFIKLPKITKNAEKSDGSDMLPTLIDFTKRENLFHHVYGGTKIPNFPTPKVYYCEDYGDGGYGGLAAEDLTDQMYAVEYIPGFDDPQILRLLEALAGFHYQAFSSSDPRSQKERVDQFDYDHNIEESFADTMFSSAKNLEEYRPEWFKGRLENLKWAYEKDYVRKALEHPRIRGLPWVLVHSDLNATNVLWRKGSKTDDLVAVIDFQMVCKGSMVSDIIRILTLGTSYENRTKNTDRYLEHYYNSLQKIAKDELKFTLEDVHKSYEDLFALCSTFTLFGISIYYQMYKEEVIKSAQVTVEEACEELLSRAKGIIEDMEKFGNRLENEKL